MNKERKPTFNYILNDMALLSLLTKCLYSEYPSEQDKYDLEYQVKLLLGNETKLKKEKYEAIEYMQDYCEIVVPDANIKSLILKEEYKKIIEILEGKNDRKCCTKEHNKLFET